MTSWVPSHVELTIHQARDLLLKTKNSGSVVYVSVVAEREKYISPSLIRSTAPLWEYSTRIPLMSLDTTLLCTVRQKTSIKDKFLGLVKIPLSTFTISSKPVTHWYKLGAKPGKTNNKLRGELLLTIKFLSNWVAEEPELLDFVVSGSKGHHNKLKEFEFAKPSPLAFHRKSLLKRTRSEVTPRSSDMSEMEGEKTSDSSKSKKEKSGLFRLSLRKKTRSPVLAACDNEFTLSHPSKVDSPSSSLPPSFPHHSPQKDGGEVSDGTFPASESLSRTLDPQYLPNGHPQTNTVEGGGDEAGEREGEREPHTEKMSPALRYHAFKRKKRPWSMHALPSTPVFQTEDTPQTESIPGIGIVQTGKKHKSHGEEKQSEVETYRAKSSSLTRSANSRKGTGRSKSINLEGQSPVDTDREFKSRSTQSTPTHSPLVGSGKALQSSDRSRSSGLGNITHSSTLPANIRPRSQSTSGGTTSKSATHGGALNRKTDSNHQQKSAHNKSVGLGPRVPLGTSRTDSLSSSQRGSVASHTPHIVSTDVTTRSSNSTPRGGSHTMRNPSPIQLDSTLVEEDEEGQEEEGEGGRGRKRSSVKQKKLTEQTVTSRVPIDTESAAFQVDTRELQVTLEANPCLSVGRSTAASQPVQLVKQGSTSLPSSPSQSPAKHRRLSTVPGSNPPTGNLQRSATPPTHNLRKSSEPQLLATFPEKSDSRAHSTSPGVDDTDQGRGNPCLSERSVSMTLPRNYSSSIKHTVSSKEKSAREYEAIPALPPSLSRSQTLPRLGAEADRTLSTRASPSSTPRKDQGLYNIRTFDPRLFNLPPLPQRSQTEVSGTRTSIEETDSPATLPKFSPSSARSVSPEIPRSLPITPQKPSQGYHGVSTTPSQEKGGGKKGGGLHAAMSRYQENKRNTKTRRRSQDNTGKALQSELEGTTSVSAGNSPEVLRRASTHLGHIPRSPDKGWKNPFSNLRRTQSYKVARGQHTHATEVDASGLQGTSQSSGSLSSTSSGSRFELAAPLIEEEHGVPGSMEVAARLSPTSSDAHHNPSLEAAGSNREEQRGSLTVATPTSLTSDTDSIRTYGSERTLVDVSTTADVSSTTTDSTTGNITSLRQELLSLPPTRHKQTCSSLDSEGLGSLASEEIEEAGPQDWTQWSKEDLVKELVLTKNKLRSSEEELKAVRGYLDNLLLRIMETNPGMLSVGNL